MKGKEERKKEIYVCMYEWHTWQVLLVIFTTSRREEKNEVRETKRTEKKTVDASWVK
jgi:hypothetical protein